MHENIDLVLQRGDRLEELVDKSDDLRMQSAQFYKKALKKRTICASCYECWYGCVCGCPVCTCQYLVARLKGMFPNKTLFYNVLADTENAFQALAKLLDLLQGICDEKWSLLQKLLFGYIVETVSFLVSFLLYSHLPSYLFCHRFSRYWS